jgi:hypothetical protein
MKKDDQREIINKEVERFLSLGKQITELPPAPEEATLPGGMQWWTLLEEFKPDEDDSEDEDDG